MPAHFFVDPAHAPELVSGAEISLDSERSHYLNKVLRHKAGDEVVCFDGQGLQVNCRVSVAHPKSSQLTVLGTTRISDPKGANTHLALGVLKGQAMDRAILLATEMGADRITLLQCARSNVHLDVQRWEKKLTHWRKIIIGACEQSARLFIPKLDAPRTPADFVAEVSRDHTVHKIMLHMKGQHLPETIARTARVLMIGPEGGWSEEELKWCEDQGCQVISLGSRTMRAESVPAAAMAVLQYVDASLQATESSPTQRSI